jgi:hypothetical protein
MASIALTIDNNNIPGKGFHDGWDVEDSSFLPPTSKISNNFPLLTLPWVDGDRNIVGSLNFGRHHFSKHTIQSYFFKSAFFASTGPQSPGHFD